MEQVHRDILSLALATCVENICLALYPCGETQVIPDSLANSLRTLHLRLARRDARSLFAWSVVQVHSLDTPWGMAKFISKNGPSRAEVLAVKAWLDSEDHRRSLAMMDDDGPWHNTHQSVVWNLLKSLQLEPWDNEALAWAWMLKLDLYCVAGDLPCVVVERGLKFLSHLYGGEERLWAQVNRILVNTDPYTDHRHEGPTVSNYTLIPKHFPGRRKPATTAPRPIRGDDRGGIGAASAAAHMGLLSANKKAAPMNRSIIRERGSIGGISGAHARANATTRIALGGGRWGDGKIPKPRTPRTYIESTATRRQKAYEYHGVDYH